MITPAQLTKALGTPVPPAWLALLRLAHEHARSRDEFVMFFDAPLSLVFSGPALAALPGMSRKSYAPTYPQMPPEFIEIGSMGVDGVTYGLIVRAPERPDFEPPVAEFSPMDSEPVFLLGRTTAQAIENLAAESLARRESADSEPFLREQLQVIRERLSLLRSRLGLAITPKLASRRFSPSGNARRIPVAIPPRYRFAPTADGIGVLAPARAFSPASRSRRVSSRTPLSDILDHVDDLLRRGYPASALRIAKSAWWWHWGSSPASSIAEALARTYRALGRHAFARRALSAADRS
ncbi:MAG: hypothetical protein ACKVW3_04555 [Phycisphaerales bacterium]